ncbi:hypothetical protein R84B8_02767 [Treponema sp. R8-4-B8]
MKKIIVILIILLTVAGALSADPIYLGNFPLGQWLDANYDAVWDFTSNNIRILSTDGRVLYDFSDKTIQDFKVTMEGTQPAISFTCPEAGRSYKFLKPLLNDDLNMRINRYNRAEYSVTMRKQ